MRIIVLLGAPGAGKGTQADILKKVSGLKHLSTGDILRAQVKAGTPLGKKVEPILVEGDLVDDQTMIGIMNDCLGEKKGFGVDGVESGFILDGFPRNINQGIAFDKILEKCGHVIEHVVYLDVDERILFDRIEHRIKNSNGCKRTDDNARTLKHRLEIFTEQTKPLVPFYEEKGLLRRIDGMNSIESVTEELLSIIGNRQQSNSSGDSSIETNLPPLKSVCI